MKFKKGSLGIVVLFSMYFTFGQQVEYNRNVDKSFAVNNQTKLELENKYGKVELMTWNKDSVVVHISLQVKAKTKDKLDKMVSGIDFSFNSTDHYLVIKTLLLKTKTDWMTEFSNLTSINMQAASVDIAYKVYMPAYMNFSLDNKFGDVYIGDITGNARIAVSNGNLKAHDFMGDTKVDLRFGDASINKFVSGQLLSSYADVTISNTGVLEVDSKSSTLVINEAGSLTIASKRDKISIRQVKTAHINSSFSTLEIKELQSKLSANVSYGKLNIEMIGGGFSLIDVQSKYSDINLVFRKGTAYLLTSQTQKCESKLPDNIQGVQQETINVKDQIYKTTGYSIRANATNRVNINAVSGHIMLVQDF